MDVALQQNNALWDAELITKISIIIVLLVITFAFQMKIEMNGDAQKKERFRNHAIAVYVFLVVVGFSTYFLEKNGHRVITRVLYGFALFVVAAIFMLAFSGIGE
jgi:hypothetical protein